MRDNIIVARFRGGSSCRTAPVWQYDYGQIMQFPDLDLPQSYEVHFSAGGPAVQAIGGPDGVAVPDALLLRSGALTTYVYLHTGEADGETVYTVTTPVTPRAAVTHEQPTPVQQDAITQAIAALNTAVDEAEGIRDAIPETVETALEAAKESGEFDGEDGAPGRDGQDGVSPTASVTQTATGATVTVTDASGTTTANLTNGKDGEPGQDGYSPTASVSKSGDTATITITDKDGTTTAQVEDGQDGQDGVSPTITVTDITGGHRVTITDKTGAHSFDVMDGEDGGGAVQDVQVNGVSVVSDGVAEIPNAKSGSSSSRIYGAVSCASGDHGVQITNNGLVAIYPATSSDIKAGTQTYRTVAVNRLNEASFYGLAKAAGSDEKNSTLPVGQYTESAKSAISEMLSGSVSVSGTTPTINALTGIRYVCGECATLDIVTPASGIVDVVFTSGSTPTVLTVTPPSGVTMKWANGFDPTSLEADTVYEINVMDGCLGVAGTWS